MKRHRIRRIGAVAATIALGLSLSACIQADQGADWSTSHLADGGTIAGQPSAYVTYGGARTLGDTAQTALALKATNHAEALAKVLNYLEHHVSDYINIPASGGTPAYVDAGHTAMLLLVAKATGSESAFHSDSLLTTLLGTQQTSGPHAGMFGADDPTYDGTYRTSLALMALQRYGYSTNSTSVNSGLVWLRAQQCPSGGFTSSVIENPCNGVGSSYQGPDTNSTAQAIEALRALGRPTGQGMPIARAVAWLATLETANATWPWYPGIDPDSNSTAIVAVGLWTAGQRLNQAPWQKPSGVNPWLALMGFQVTTPGPNFGGFIYQPGMLADPISTEQVTYALSGNQFPPS